MFVGTNMGDHGPLEARELSPQEPFNETAFPKHRKGIWLLKTSIIRNYCYLPPRRPILHLSGGFNLFRTEVLQ
jgi:hypothetical protein